MPISSLTRFAVPLFLLASGSAGAQAQSVVYRCPGPPVLYTDTMTPKEAQEKGCRTIEGAPVTVIQAPRPRTPAAAPATPNASGGGSGSERIDPQAQRNRDSERRRVLDAELREAESRLAAAQAEYANGNAEKIGGEHRNNQKYLDRMAELKATISRQEADIQALKREISKLP